MADELPCGWVPPSRRTDEQMEFDLAVKAEMPRAPMMDEPLVEFFSFGALALKLMGKYAPNCHQQTGSCVGAGGAKASINASMGDAYYDKSGEVIKLNFPFTTWGKGRQLGGLKGRGDGSFGSAQAEAIGKFGQIPWDHPSVPKPDDIDGDWYKWTAQVEEEYSWPPQWPVPERELEGDHKKHIIDKVIPMKSARQVAQFMQKGFGITMASMWGMRDPKIARLTDGVLLGRRDGEWGHQMSADAFAQHKQLGLMFLDMNQWGQGVHGICPYLNGILKRVADEAGVEHTPFGGAFWILEEDMQWMCESGEVFAHRETRDFDDPRKPIDIWEGFSFVTNRGRDASDIA